MSVPGHDDVTVVIPTHNRVDTLPAALQSALGQEGVCVQVVVVDDASSDATADFLDSVDADRITALRHELARGPAAARNTGVGAARTRWVAFLDDDDLWSPLKLARQLEVVAAVNDARWSTTGTVSVDPDLCIVGHQRPTFSGRIFDDLLAHNVVPAGNSTVLVERELFEQVGGFDETLDSCEDYDLWCRLARESPIATVDAPLIAYRVAPGARSHQADVVRRSHHAITARYRTGPPTEDTRDGDLTFAQYSARFHLRRGDRFAACRAYLDIARRYRLPTHVVHAGLALLAPAFSERHRARAERAEIPEDWARSADSWLAPHRQSSPAAALGS